MLQFMGSQRVGHDGATELNRTKLSRTELNRTMQINYASIIKCCLCFHPHTGLIFIPSQVIFLGFLEL